MADLNCKEHGWEWTDGDPGCPFCLRSKLETEKAQSAFERENALAWKKDLESAKLQYGEALKLISAMICYLGNNFLCDRNDSCKCIDHDARRFLAAAKKPVTEKRACPKCGFWNCEESCQAPGKYAEKRVGQVSLPDGSAPPDKALPSFASAPDTGKFRDASGKIRVVKDGVEICGVWVKDMGMCVAALPCEAHGGRRS